MRKEIKPNEEFPKRRGRKLIGATKRKHVCIYLDHETTIQLMVIANNNDLTKSQMIAQLISDRYEFEAEEALLSSLHPDPSNSKSISPELSQVRKNERSRIQGQINRRRDEQNDVIPAFYITGEALKDTNTSKKPTANAVFIDYLPNKLPIWAISAKECPVLVARYVNVLKNLHIYEKDQALALLEQHNDIKELPLAAIASMSNKIKSWWISKHESSELQELKSHWLKVIKNQK